MTQPASSPGAPLSGLKEIEQRERNALTSDADARRQLNALAVTSSFVSALIRFPGPAGSHEQAVEAAQLMMRAAQATTAALLNDLRMGDEPWKRFRLMRMVAQAVSSNWRATASQGVPSADVEHMRPVWAALARYDVASEDHEGPPSDEVVALQIAVLDAMAPITREIDVFDLFHEPLSAARHARDVILNAAESSRRALLGADASDSSRRQLFASLLRNAGVIYSTAWRRHAEDLFEDLRKKSPEQQSEAVRQHPGGFPLDGIDQAFREAFARLVDMVEYLAPPRVGPAQQQGQDAGGSDSRARSGTLAERGREG